MIELKYSFRNILIVIIACLILLIFYISNLGINSRNYGDFHFREKQKIPTYPMSNSKQLYHFLEKQGVAGATFVQIGRYLNFVPLDGQIDSMKSGRPNQLIKKYKKLMTEKSFLWLASEANIVRQIYYVLPSEIVKKRLNSNINEGFKNVSVVNNSIIIDDWGFKRNILMDLPKISEPVIVNIDASFFSFDVSPVELCRKIKQSNLRIVLLIASFSDDNEKVGEVEKAKLKNFVECFKSD